MDATYENLRELAQMPWIKASFAVCISWALQMVGHPESAAMLLFSLLICDLALGVSRSFKEDLFKPWRITRGAFKFFRYWLAVAVFVMADGAIKKAMPALPVSISDTFIAYLAINEALSCIEHLAVFGMPVPQPFLRRLRKYREQCLSGRVEDATGESAKE